LTLLSALLLAHPVPTFGSKCPDETWEMPSTDDRWCYKKFPDTPMPMDDAESYCRGFGGHLASLLSQEEQNFAMQVLTFRTTFDDYWIGMRQKNGSQNDDLSAFEWTDGSAVKYEYFSTGKANSNDGLQKCVVMHGGWWWVSKDCAVRERFICKVASNTISPYTTAYPITTPKLTMPCDSGSKVDGWIANPKEADPQFCYFFPQDMTNKLDFQSATKYCNKRGGSLVSIHSEQENAFVITNLNKQNAWIGYNSMYSGEFQWTDGSDVGYQRWDPNEPNGGDKQEDCVEVYGETGGWNDRSCDQPLTFACKKPKNGTLPTPKPTDAPSGYCPSSDFFEIDGYCYQLFKDSSTWKDARSKCKAIGNNYNLASIHSSKQNALVASMLYANTNLQNQVWIGGYQNDKNFLWNDYSTFNVEYWAPHQPDGNKWGDNCLAMNTDTQDQMLGTWNDEDCSSKLNYVCKGPASPENQPTEKPKCTLSGFETFVPYQSNCYMEFTSAASWSQAEAQCQSMGAHLVSIRDWSQQAGLFSVIQGENFWIGLSNIEPKSNAAFWSDGYMLDIHNWAAFVVPEQPSCIYMNTTDGKWYAQDCESKMNYVCMASSDPHPPERPDFKGYCPEGFKDAIPKGDTCYSIGMADASHVAEMWSHAILSCREKGADLASITSSEETTAMIQLLKKEKVTDDVLGLWIGLVAYRDAIGLGPIWRWTDGSNISVYSNWADEFPTNRFSTAAQCAFVTTSGQWKNTDCHSAQGSPKHHICQTLKVQQQKLPGPGLGPNQGLSAGGKAAIVLCSLLGVAGIVVGALVLRKKDISIGQLLKFKSTSSSSNHRNIGVDNMSYGVDP